MARATARAAADPARMPNKTGRNPSESTSQSTSPLRAPRATRIPSSGVRRATRSLDNAEDADSRDDQREDREATGEQRRKTRTGHRGIEHLGEGTNVRDAIPPGRTNEGESKPGQRDRSGERSERRISDNPWPGVLGERQVDGRRRHGIDARRANIANHADDRAVGSERLVVEEEDRRA